MRETTHTFGFVLLAVICASASSLEEWKNKEDAAAVATKAGHYREAESLLRENQKLAESFPAKDARPFRTSLDLAHVYRAEGKYSEALASYERVRQTYTDLYGPESSELAETLDGEGELYKNLGDYSQAEPLL